MDEKEKTLGELKKFHRILRMRDMTPDEVNDTLDVILRDALIIIKDKGARLSQKAIKEIRDIQQDLSKKKIDAGATAHDKQLDRFTKMVENFDQTNENDSKLRDRIEGLAESSARTITDSIPSTDDLISAISSDSPIIGYALKSVKNVLSRQLESRRAQKEYELQRRDIAKEQLEQIKEEKSNIEEYEKDVDDSDSSDLIKINEGMLNTMKSLENIDSSLYDFFTSDDETESELEKLNESTQDTNNNLERVVELTEEQIAEGKRQFELAEDRLRQRDAKDRDLLNRQRLATREQSRKGGVFSSGVVGAVSSGGGLGGIGGFLGGIGLKAIGGIGAIAGMILAGGKILAGFAGKAALLAIGIKGALDFADGFIRAEEILGRENLLLSEKFITGLSGVIVGLGDWINKASNLLGFDDLIDLSDRDGMIKSLSEFLLGIYNWAVDRATDFFQFIFDGGYRMEIFNKVKNSLFSVLDSLFDIIKNTIGHVGRVLVDLKDSIMFSIWDNIYAGLEDLPFGLGDRYKQKRIDLHENERQRLITDDERLPEFISQGRLTSVVNDDPDFLNRLSPDMKTRALEALDNEQQYKQRFFMEIGTRANQMGSDLEAMSGAMYRLMERIEEGNRQLSVQGKQSADIISAPVVNSNINNNSTTQNINIDTRNNEPTHRRFTLENYSAQYGI